MTSDLPQPATKVKPCALGAGKALPPWRGYALRKLLHAGAGCLLAALAVLLPGAALLLALGLAASLLAVEVLRFARPRVNEWLVERFGGLVKGYETKEVSGATYLALASALVLVLFDPRVAALALVYTAVGDPVAGLVGDRFGRWHWKGKSVEGAFAFLVAAAVAGFSLAALGVEVPLPARSLGAVVAAGMEILPAALDDNVTVPVASAVAMTLVAALAPGL